MAHVKCEECGQQISTDVKACPNCGRIRTSAGTLGRAVNLLFCLGIVIISMYTNGCNTSNHSVPPKPPKERPVASASERNAAHAKMLKFTEEERLALMTQFMQQSGEVCNADKSFFRGIDPKDDTAYWSISCTNGKSYQIAISSDSKGSTRMAECEMLKAMGVNCFEKLTN